MKKFRHRQSAGFTLVEIMIVVSIIGLLMAVLIPNVRTANARARAQACVLNLKTINADVEMFRNDKGKKGGDPVNFPDDLMPYMDKVPVCPGGGTYSISAVGSDPTCSLGTTVTPPHVLQ